MATTAKATTTATVAYPKNLPVLGQLSFPLWSEEDITALALWRAEKGYKAGQYPDRVGGSLFLTQGQVDKVQSYIIDTFLPFTVAQYAATSGKKGFSPEAAKEIEQLVMDADWSEANLPIRELNDKDIENLGEDTDIVAKLSFSGSGGNEISKKALARSEAEDRTSDLEVVSLDSVAGIGDPDRLWWGARNWFRGAFNLNAYTREIKKGMVVYGISAYSRALYLRTDLPMNFGGGSDDEAVLETDFED